MAKTGSNGLESVLEEIRKERRRWDARWGGSAYNDGLFRTDWLLYIRDRTTVYVGKPGVEYRKALVEIAALAVAAIESYDRNK